MQSTKKIEKKCTFLAHFFLDNGIIRAITASAANTSLYVRTNTISA
jgi:hypothetical protein